MRFSFHAFGRGAESAFRALHGDRRTVLLFYLPAATLTVISAVLLVFLPVTGSLVEHGRVRAAADSARSVEGLEEPPSDLETNQAEVDSLRRREVSLQARHALARSERIGLVLDVEARVLSIETHGVTLRACSLASVRVSREARRIIQNAESPDGPVFLLSAESATIPKAPIRHVEAPRDTAEANARPPLETPTETRAPHVALHFADVLRLRIAPKPSKVADNLPGFLLDVRERLRDLQSSVALLSGGRLPRAVPWIKLEMSPADARAVYRALPADSYLAVRL